MTTCGGLNTGHFNFTGSGTDSFMFKSTENGSMTARPDPMSHQCPPWAGTAVVTSARHPANTITGSGTGSIKCNSQTGTYLAVFDGNLQF